MDEHEKEAMIERLVRLFRAHDPEGAPHDPLVDSALHREDSRRAPRYGLRDDDRERSARNAERPLAGLIDHTALRPETTIEDIRTLCAEAAEYGFASVCVNPCYVELAAERLTGSAVAICTVIGFPLGASRSETKVREAELAAADGAGEVDMVLNVGMLKSGRYDIVESDIRAVVRAVRSNGVKTKVILETALLTDEEKVIACVLAQNAGADFVKTSSGFAAGGATALDVALMRRTVGQTMGVKASGGIRSAEDALKMIAHGANRIGASASVAIVQGLSGSTS